MVGGVGLKTCVEDLCRWDQNFAHNRLPEGKYLDEFFREGTLLGNRSVLDADAALKENDPEARRKSPPGQYRGLEAPAIHGWCVGHQCRDGPVSRPGIHGHLPEQQRRHRILEDDPTIADLALGDRLAPQASRTPAPAASELPTVELKEAELRDKVGAYRMKYNGVIWRITLQDGTLRLTDQFHRRPVLSGP